MERLEKLKTACLLDRNNDMVTRDFFLELQRCMYATIRKKKLTSLPNDISEQIVLDVLVEVYNKLEKISNVLAYAQAILVKMFFKTVKQRANETPLFDKDEESLIKNSFSDKFKTLDENHLERLREIITMLPPPNNVLMSAKYLQKKQHKELASELNVPVNQIGVKTERAFKKFIKTLKEDHKELFVKLADYFDKEIAS